MGTILEDVFLGTAEKYNQKLEMLARMAQPEKWTYKRIQDKDPSVSYTHLTLPTIRLV